MCGLVLIGEVYKTTDSNKRLRRRNPQLVRNAHFDIRSSDRESIISCDTVESDCSISRIENVIEIKITFPIKCDEY